VQLQEMDVSFNHLADVQPSISECRQLTYINMSDNQIEVLLPHEKNNNLKEF
jgi:Leucine-rich repeat (LRR) protein